jgi:hypothetical protein
MGASHSAGASGSSCARRVAKSSGGETVTPWLGDHSSVPCWKRWRAPPSMAHLGLEWVAQRVARDPAAQLRQGPQPQLAEAMLHVVRGLALGIPHDRRAQRVVAAAREAHAERRAQRHHLGAGLTERIGIEATRRHPLLDGRARRVQRHRLLTRRSRHVAAAQRQRRLQPRPPPPEVRWAAAWCAARAATAPPATTTPAEVGSIRPRSWAPRGAVAPRPTRSGRDRRIAQSTVGRACFTCKVPSSRSLNSMSMAKVGSWLRP